MTSAQTTARRRAAPAEAVLALRWDDRAKRWEVTFSDRRGVVLARAVVDSTVAVDRVTATLCVSAVRNALEGMLPLE